MKVAFFIGSLNRGGTEMLTLDICRKKDYAPFEIILIYRNDGELSREFRATGVPMFRIKPKGLKLCYFWQMRRLLKREKVDVLHAQTLINAAFSVWLTLFSRMKLVASFHGFYWSKWDTVLRHIVMWKADAMVFVSKYFRNWYYNHSLWCPFSRCHVVYNGISFEKFNQDYPKPVFLSENKKEGRLKFVMVGNFNSTRSQMVICKGIKRLIEQGIDNFVFYFVGKRVEPETWRFDECVKFCVEEGLMDNVCFLGSRGDVPAILQHVDGFVYSTDHDTFGIAVVEALSSGVPVVVNDWEVMQEIIMEKNWAVMFKTNDEKDCSEKMKELIENIDSRKCLANNVKERVRRVYSIENHIEGLLEVYKALYD